MSTTKQKLIDIGKPVLNAIDEAFSRGRDTSNLSEDDELILRDLKEEIVVVIRERLEG